MSGWAFAVERDNIGYYNSDQVCICEAMKHLWKIDGDDDNP